MLAQDLVHGTAQGSLGAFEEVSHDQLTTAGIKILTPMADSPFGPMFSFEGPEGCTLTAHGGWS
ncbi:hypothetical protein ACH47Z_39215 [Streptomyces sp. NPDC020192]|uniref:hypothetical protein n=1 Tax=Streptomyces sp. NPDC020192 TaxID=3365066 RepID=UPI003787A362